MQIRLFVKILEGKFVFFQSKFIRLSNEVQMGSLIEMQRILNFVIYTNLTQITTERILTGALFKLVREAKESYYSGP